MPAPFVINEREVDTFAPPHHDATESRELINPARGSDRVVFRISDIDPGGHDAWHAHDTSEQLLYVLSGDASFWIGPPGNPDQDEATHYELEPGSFAYIPEGCYHTLEVTGTDPLRCIVIWVPPYESLADWDSTAPETE